MARRAKQPKVPVPGTAIAVRTPRKTPPPRPAEPEKLPEPETLTVPAPLLLAAEQVCRSATLSILSGVYLYSRDGRARIASIDGVSRMFLASFPIVGKAPDWLAEGIVVSNENLKARVSMIGKGGSVQVRYAKGFPKAQLSDTGAEMVFNQAVVEGDYPDPDRFVREDSFVSLDDAGETRGQEWQPVGIGSAFLKQIGEVAKTLEAGLDYSSLDKEQKARLKITGMVIRAYQSGQPETPQVFDFVGWPGVLLIIMPHRLGHARTSPETAALLAPAIKLTLAALRAHATRWLMAAEKTDDETQKMFALEKAKTFQRRVAEILERAPGASALEGPAAEAAPVPETHTGHDAGAPAPEPEGEGSEDDDMGFDDPDDEDDEQSELDLAAE